jgi:5-methyltetrahydropteroyltriglutamate--homocysteine methyltransferase
VGSLVRPNHLLPTHPDKAAAQGDASNDALKAAITEVVARQVRTGLDIVNDGEFGKSSWAAYALDRMTGFEVREEELRPLEWLGRDRERFADFFAEMMPSAIDGMPTEACTGAITYIGTKQMQRSLQDMRAAAAAANQADADVFMTAVAPASMAYNGINEFYGSDREYVFAVADALREEYLAIYEAGFLVQVDDALLANMYDTLVAKDGDSYREWAQLRVDALNHALRGIPPESVRYHICFGSWHVPHVADAPLEEILDFILQVNAQGYMIESANVRHEHEWRVWEKTKLPQDKILIPGVITHHTSVVEHPRLVADRILRFAKLVGRENVIAGTDCGFAQTVGIQRVHPSVMWAKLESLVEGARLASGELWG